MLKNPQFDRLIDRQNELAAQVALRSPFASLKEIRTVGGLYVHFSSEADYSAACVTVALDGLKPVGQSVCRGRREKPFPYVPGFLAFREVPVLLQLVRTLGAPPDVFLCNGHGIAHPRRSGLASHLGVTIGKPTIGCAQMHLYGEYIEPPPGVKGAYQFLRDGSGDMLGIVLRTRPNIRPVFVSPGHLMDIEMAGDIVLAACSRYRVPEPLRLARMLALGGEKPGK